MSLPPVFDQAIERVFTTWTTLALAVEHEWGGRDSKQKRQGLQEEIAQHLIACSKRRRIPSHENQDDVNNLADMLFKRLDELFNCEVDDGSDSEVAYLCLRLFNTCREGDTSFADDFLKKFTKGADLSKCQGNDTTQYVTEEEMLLSGMQGLDLEGIREANGEGDSGSGSEAGEGAGEGAARGAARSKGRGGGGGGGGGGEQAAPGEGAAGPAEGQEGEEDEEAKASKAKARVVQEPIIDEDGFETVVKGRRRR